MSKPPQQGAEFGKKGANEPESSHQAREGPGRRLSELQRNFGGAVKRKVVVPRGNVPLPRVEETGYQFPKLRRGLRRPTFERSAGRGHAAVAANEVQVQGLNALAEEEELEAEEDYYEFEEEDNPDVNADLQAPGPPRAVSIPVPVGQPSMPLAAFGMEPMVTPPEHSAPHTSHHPPPEVRQHFEEPNSFHHTQTQGVEHHPDQRHAVEGYNEDTPQRGHFVTEGRSPEEHFFHSPQPHPVQTVNSPGPDSLWASPDRSATLIRSTLPQSPTRSAMQGSVVSHLQKASVQGSPRAGVYRDHHDPGVIPVHQAYDTSMDTVFHSFATPNAYHSVSEATPFHSITTPSYPSVNAPTIYHSVTTPAPHHSVNAPAPHHSVNAPAPHHSVNAPAPHHSVNAPATHQSVNAPAPHQSVNAPAPHHSVTTPTPYHSYTTQIQSSQLGSPLAISHHDHHPHHSHVGSNNAPITHQPPGASLRHTAGPQAASYGTADDRSAFRAPAHSTEQGFTRNSQQYSVGARPGTATRLHHLRESRMERRTETEQSHPRKSEVLDETVLSFSPPDEPLAEDGFFSLNPDEEMEVIHHPRMTVNSEKPHYRKSTKLMTQGSLRRETREHGSRVRGRSVRRSAASGPRSFGALQKESEEQLIPVSKNQGSRVVRRATLPKSRGNLGMTESVLGLSWYNARSKSRSKRYSPLIGEDNAEWDEEGGSARRTKSVLFPVLQDKEKHFHELVAAGDVSAVRRFLADHPDININCVSYQTTSALHVAIRELNKEMLEELLKHKQLEKCDAVLTAVKVGDLEILNTVLSHLEESHPGLEFAPCPNSTDFADDVTPLMLAAREGKFEVVDLLLKRGHRMPDLHDPYCDCKQCMANLERYDRLKYSAMKINLYKAVASPTYLFQTTDDPILRAFQLTSELQAAARMFPQFKGEYEELWKQLKTFAAQLIGCCRNAEEVEIILKQPAGCEAAGQLFYPRLQLAIDVTQKEFVAHPHVQAVLESAWTGDIGSWKKRSALGQALAPLFRIPWLFVIFALSCCMPKNVMINKYHYPVNKFVSSYASYLIFLAVLFVQSTEDKTDQKRGPPSSGWKYLIIIFVMGHIWCGLRLCFMLGPKRFFTIGWSWFDCAMDLCFLFTFMFWLAAWADVTANQDEELPRRYWDAFDPSLISEGLLVLATILAFLRLYLPMSLNYYLGPLQISIGKMTVDIFRFVFIFALMILAWSVGMAHFYQYYDGMVQYDSSSNSNTTQISSFVSFPMTLKTYFWAIFGMSPIESADVVIGNLEGQDPGTTVVNKHEFTEGVGYFTFAMYQFLAVVVVLNMLVACMANTFTKVIDNVSVEWVFARTKIYLMYMYHGTLPSPFNLFPTLSDLTTAITWLSLLGKSDPKTRAGFSFTHCCYIARAPEVSVNRDFPALMSQLAQRYLRLEEAEGGIEEGSHDVYKADLQELKTLVGELITLVNAKNESI